MSSTLLSVEARPSTRKSQYLDLKASVLLSHFCVFVSAAWLFSPLFVVPLYAHSKGMTVGLATYLVSILNTASFPGRIIPGILGDKVGPINIVIFFSICSGVLVFCCQTVQTNATILLAVLYGFCSGAIVTSMFTSIVSCSDDPENFSPYAGMGISLSSAAALVDPPISTALLTDVNDVRHISYFSGVAAALINAMLAITSKCFAPYGLFGKS